MEFKDLISSFAVRHKVENLVAVDDAAALDIDGIIVTIVARGDQLTLSADVGEPPAEGAATFSEILLEANLQSGAFFAKAPDPGPYIVVQRLSLPLLDDNAFDSVLEVFVNQAETWRKLLADFRPAAKAAAERRKVESPSFEASGFMQV